MTPRADARRNRDLLLAAATRVLAERGPDAPLDEIARAAGVGNATLYRHFPTRGDLLVAVYADEIAALTARGEALLTAGDPADALFEWLALFRVHVATKHDLALGIPADANRSALFDGWHRSMHATAAALLTRAQQAGTVRADVLATDLTAMVSGIALGGADPAQAERLLALARRGATT